MMRRTKARRVSGFRLSAGQHAKGNNDEVGLGRSLRSTQSGLFWANKSPSHDGATESCRVGKEHEEGLGSSPGGILSLPS